MGPEVNLGLNVDLNLDASVQDASTLASQIKEMRMDQEAFRDIVADTQERIRETTAEYQEQLSLRQQMLDVEQSLKNLSESRTQSLQDQTNAYRDMEQTMGRLGQTMAMGGGYGGGGYGMGGGYGGGGYGGGMSGFYNPMSGMTMNMGGFPSAFSGTPAEEAAEAEEIEMEEKNKGSIDRLRQHAQDLFYFANIPSEIKGIAKSMNGQGAKVLDSSAGARALARIQKTHPALALRLTDAATGGGLSALAAGTSLEGAMSLLGPIGVATSATMLGYKGISHALQTGQEYGALTGQTGFSAIGGGYRADLQSFFGSFLNPLMPDAVSQQIEATGLAAGYKIGTPYLKNYRSFASGAFERFQISPQESQQMFQNAVVVAGGSLSNLSNALQGTADMAVRSGVSFQGAVQNLNSMMETLTSYGAKGAIVTNTATMMNAAFTGSGQQMSQTMQGVGMKITDWAQSSLIGQALTAQAVGTNVQGLYGYEQGHGGVNSLAVPALTAIGGIIGRMGVGPHSTQPQLDNAVWRTNMALQSMGLDLPQNQVAGLVNEMAKHPGDIGRAMAGSLTAPSIGDYKHAVLFSNGKGGSSAIPVWDSPGAHTAYNKAEAQYKSQQKALGAINNLTGGSATGNSRTDVMIGLAPNAAKILTVQQTNSQADSGTTNRNTSNGSVGR